MGGGVSWRRLRYLSKLLGRVLLRALPCLRQSSRREQAGLRQQRRYPPGVPRAQRPAQPRQLLRLELQETNRSTGGWWATTPTPVGAERSKNEMRRKRELSRKSEIEGMHVSRRGTTAADGSNDLMFVQADYSRRPLLRNLFTFIKAQISP